LREIPVTAIETPTFLKKAERFFDDDERAELVFYIASNPEAGQVMTETGGNQMKRVAAAILKNYRKGNPR
jgi:hypothetical protein